MAFPNLPQESAGTGVYGKSLIMVHVRTELGHLPQVYKQGQADQEILSPSSTLETRVLRKVEGLLL